MNALSTAEAAHLNIIATGLFIAWAEPDVWSSIWLVPAVVLVVSAACLLHEEVSA